MVDLQINWSEKHPKILCLGAHADDIEIGCGGAILNLLANNIKSEICWVVFSANEERRQEALESAHLFLKNSTKKNIIIRDFRENYFPYNGGEIKEYFNELRGHFNPDLIFTHYRNDLHQDHRLIYDLTLNAYRDHLILEYEIPKYDGDLGSPHVFVPLDERVLDFKIKSLLKYFQSQKDKPWFSKDTFRALPRLRGIESKSQSGYAEAFFCRKMVLANFELIKDRNG